MLPSQVMSIARQAAQAAPPSYLSSLLGPYQVPMPSLAQARMQLQGWAPTTQQQQQQPAQQEAWVRASALHSIAVAMQNSMIRCTLHADFVLAATYSCMLACATQEEKPLEQFLVAFRAGANAPKPPG